MKWNQISFRYRMLIIMTVSGLLQLLVLTLAGFSYIKQSQEEEMGLKAKGVATFLAQSSSVIHMIQYDTSSLMQARYRGLTEMIGAAFIVIGDKDGIRLIHPVDERIGLPMKGGIMISRLSMESLTSRSQKALLVNRFEAKPPFSTKMVMLSVLSL
ncbi:sensor kinase CitA DpiB [Vibrio variabilis]|uniref:Sensor kinase CitA DpiB n=1 Tax=Vibrio variabilis TaxID=990271 RepID=A0ABQ0JRJ3_9VIBR|nr:sensor kinase CitA DpiB [Vibrio variabilis]